MKRLNLIFIVFIYAGLCTAQEGKFSSSPKAQLQFPDGAIPDLYDSIYLLTVQELTLPESKMNLALPPIVDNSASPHLRPVFTQVGASCGQSASVGYNFTYEMDQARNLPADTSINQYPTHFVYNFGNTGYEYFGVSCFHSFEILKKCGTMNVKDYGGLTDNGNRWISGYNYYYNGMFNRIEDVYTIKTNTEKGIRTLKSWVYDHMGESSEGGLANFNTGYSLTHLPAGTPEQGRPVATSFTYPATHAMTIVGYNDSIRFDYNNDGLYTNTMDINADGIVDVKDWEIGGFRVVNSYGADWPSEADSGFFYMMYHTLAEDYGSGGIWNNAVHVIKVKPDYSPLLTMKVRLTHLQRNALRVRAGVSGNVNSLVADQILDFPIFNFQGGPHPAQGPGLSDTLNTIEFGLDITPLLSYMNTNKDAAIFLIVDDNNPLATSAGKIEQFAVIDYSVFPPHIFDSQQVPVAISDNDQTILRIVTNTGTDKVNISSNNLPAFTPGQPYAVQLSATSGQPPYTWSMNYQYTENQDNKPMPALIGNKLVPVQPSDSTVAVPLGFRFPFFGKLYDTLFVNINNGYIQFDTDNIPWPYLNEENLLLRSFRLIAPVTNQGLNIYSSDEGAWYEGDSISAIFRWKLSKKQGETYFPYEFQATLSANGTITFNHDHISLTASELFHSGISNGDKLNYNLKVYHHESDANQYSYTQYTPGEYPDNLTISKTGLVECTPKSAETIYTIPCIVSDYRNITDAENCLLSSGIHTEIAIHAGNDSIICNGEIVNADLILTNLTSDSYTDLAATLSITDSFVTLTDSIESINLLQPNSRILIQNAFTFSVSPQVHDKKALLMYLTAGNNLYKWKHTIPAIITAPLLKSNGLSSTKPGNALLQPGETGWLQYKISNIGHAEANDVEISIELPDAYATLLTAPVQIIGGMVPGQKQVVDFQVTLDDSIPLGTTIPVICNVTSEGQLKITDTLFFRVGMAPALVIDLDNTHTSAPAIWQHIKDLGYLSDYSTLINSSINEYQSLFITLGKNAGRHVLSYSESLTLSDYLDRGGNIYLESRYTWRDDVLTALQPRFNIQTVNKLHVYDTLFAMSGAFTDGMIFTASNVLVSMYYMQPLWNAFGLFDDNGYSCSIANDAGTFKTIGNLFEFSALQGANTESTQEALMQKYLDFFNIKRNAIGIDESAAGTVAGEISIYPNPATERTSLSFSLSERGPVRISILDINGSEVNELIANDLTNQDIHFVEWNLCNKARQRVLPGIYFCRIIGSGNVLFGKILVN